MYPLTSELLLACCWWPLLLLWWPWWLPPWPPPAPWEPLAPLWFVPWPPCCTDVTRWWPVPLERRGARNSNMLWVCWLSIFSRLSGMGSVQKKSWSKAALASSLRLGQRQSNLSSKSTANWSFTYGLSRSLTRRFWLVLLGISSLLKSSRFSTPGQTSGVIAPQSWAMSVSWCCSVLPCMMGERVHISAIIHPAPHRSTGAP